MSGKLPLPLIAYPYLFERLLSLNDQGMAWIDERGTILHHNEALAKKLGTEVEELTGYQVFDLEEDLNLLEFKKRWRSLKASGHHSWKVQWKAPLAKSSVTLVFTAQMAYSPEGEVSCWSLQPEGSSNGVSTEISSSFLKDQKIATWQWDLIEGRFIYSDQFFEILPDLDLQLPQNRMLNILSALKGRIAEHSFRYLMEHIKKLQREQQGFKLELETQGEEQSGLYLFAEPKLNQGIVTRIQGLLVPAQQSGNEFERLAKLALDRADAMICWIDPDCTIRYANHTLCKRLGYTQEELQQKVEITEIDADHTVNQWRKIWEEVTTRQTMELESTLRTKDSRVFPAAFYLNYLDIKGQKLLSLSARDVTERRRKEAELQKALLDIRTLSGQLEAENVYLKEEATAEYNFENIITQSPAYKKVLQHIEQVAPSEATVLIEGETGTGKELLAHAIHNLSPRKDRAMVRVNCAALAETLILSELFGHEKGAFTGANSRKIGRFELANGGTIFLDEIGEVPLDIQAKLLRVLQEGEFERVGGVETIQVDVRVIAATNRDLRNMVKEGKFREDLYYRLSVFPFRNLPLRERREDIPLLVRHFMTLFAKKNGKQVEKINTKDMDRLRKYEFPGNIRELMNIVEQAVVLSQGETLNFSYWNPVKPQSHLSPEAADEFLTLEELQRQHIVDALEKTRWRVTGPNGAAKLLGLNGQTLFSKMKKLGIRREE